MLLPVKDKSDWLEFSNIEDPLTGHVLYIDTSDGTWAIFNGQTFSQEGFERESLPDDFKPLWDDLEGGDQ